MPQPTRVSVTIDNGTDYFTLTANPDGGISVSLVPEVGTAALAILSHDDASTLAFAIESLLGHTRPPF